MSAQLTPSAHAAAVIESPSAAIEVGGPSLRDAGVAPDAAMRRDEGHGHEHGSTHGHRTVLLPVSVSRLPNVTAGRRSRCGGGAHHKRVRVPRQLESTLVLLACAGGAGRANRW